MKEMRITVLLALLGVPASVLAQGAAPGTGVIATSSPTINIAQCTGVASSNVDLQDAMEMDLRWTVALDAVTPQFTQGGIYRVHVANEQPAAGQALSSGTGTSCTQPANSSTTFKSVPLGADTDAVSQTSATRTFSMKDIVTAAGQNCTDQSSATIYLCVQWLDSGGVAHGWANATVTLDRTTPSAPTGVGATGGDSALYLHCTAGDSTTSSFKAIATSAADGSTHLSNRASNCGELVIGGLVNEQTYSVVVYGLDAAGNPSAASATIQAQPVQTDDFWTHYKNEGGRESGGCSQGAPGLLALLALLALRGRRS